MAGIIEQRDLGLARLADEGRDRVLHAFLAGVELEVDVEAEFAERLGDRARIGRRVGERHARHLVGAVADDQGDAFRGEGARGADRHENGQAEPEHGRAHGTVSAEYLSFF
jgi:hypothetical protein